MSHYQKTKYNIRINSLDNIRGLAIILVLIAHLGFFYWGSYSTIPFISTLINFDGITTHKQFESTFIATHKSFESTLINFIRYIQSDIDLGILGVSLFFLLSGFLFAHQQEKDVILNIFIKRLCRIILPVITIYYLLEIFISDNEIPRWGGDGKNLLGLINLPSMGIFWSLEVKLRFYLVYLIFSISNKKRLFLAQSFIIIFDIFYRLHLNIWVSFILIGVGCKFNRLCMCIIFYLIHVLILTYLKVDYFNHKQIFASSIAILIFLTLLNNDYKSKILSFFADISYSFYLIHLIVLSIISYKLQSDKINYDLIIIFGISHAIILSWISRKTIEKFSIELGKFIITKLPAIKVKK